MAFGASEQLVPADASSALPISPPHELRKRKRVQSAAQWPDSTSDSDSVRLNANRRVKKVRVPSTPESTADLPIVDVPAELFDPENVQTLKFSPGAIIAMRLVDFQVSRDATYTFEPHLNMILGSNGSGKSTVVTAMFLLFQGHIRDLGRSTFGEFVTFGQQRAVLSAVVRAKSGQRSHVLVMVIPATKISGRPLQPQWYIDGQTASEAEFAQFIASYHIQVNNLSQFLPQSRIASFAGLSPEDRLKSVEEAVGYDGMIEDHSMLANRGKELVDIDKDVCLYQKRLEDLRQRQADLEGRVNQLGSRRKEKGHLEYLNQVLKIAEYHSVESELTELHETLDKARENLRNFDTEHLPFQNEIRKVEVELSKVHTSFKETANTYKELENAYQTQQTLSRNAKEDLKTRIESIKTLRRERDACVVKLEQNSRTHRECLTSIARGRKTLNDMGDTDLFARQKAELAEVQERQDEITARRHTFYNEEQRLQSRLFSTELQLKRAESKLGQLKAAQTQQRSVDGIQRSVIWDRGMAAKAIRFVQQHEDKFDLPVIAPAIASVDIMDSRLAPMIGAVLTASQVFKFVCQTRADMETLTNLAANTDGINVKAVYLSENDAELSRKTIKALKHFGFEGVLSDGVTGPEPMLKFLRTTALGRTPYSLTPQSGKSRQELKSQCPEFKGFVDPQMHYSYLRSKYGRRLETEASQFIKKAPEWAKFMIRRDTSTEVNNLEETVRNLTSEQSKQKDEHTRARARLNDVTQEEKDVRAEVVELSSAVKIIEKTWQRIRLSTSRAETLVQESQALKKKMLEKTEQSTSLTNELIKIVADVGKTKLSVKEMTGLLQYSHKHSRLNTLQHDLENKRSFLRAALSERRESCAAAVAKLESEMLERQQATQEQHRQAEEATSWLRAKRKLQEGVKLAHETPLAELHAEIGRRQSLLDMRDAQGESLAVVKQKLNNVVLELHDLEDRLGMAVRRRESISSEVELTRERWVRELEERVQKSSSMFSDMFQQLQCKGSVTISKPDELAVGTWGLDVNVAFRDGEEVQKLSRNRQSGGERSVTTAVYLVSLQRMTRAPFRVLDEINQGMDKHNETKTMAFIVDNSCNRIENNQAQQYFVITPKLLFDMPYHRRMSVNFIMSSEQIDNAACLPSSPLLSQEQLEKLLEEEAHSD